MIRRSTRWSPILAVTALCVVFSPAAPALSLMPSGAPYLSAGLGIFNMVGAVNDDGYNRTPAELNLEYQSGTRLYGIGYLLGLLANTDGGIDGYGGVYANVLLSPHWILTPEAGIGGYRQGQSKNMGSTFLFRLELGLAYQLAAGQRLGVKIAHLSNGDLYTRNPGENEILVTYSVALR